MSVVYTDRRAFRRDRARFARVETMIRPTLIALAIVWFASVAVAAPKIVLPAIEGDTTGSVRDAVTAAIDGDELTVLGEKEVNRAFDRLNLETVSELTPKQAKKLSNDLEADAVVTAVYGKKGKKKSLKFRLFVNGKKAKGFTVLFKSAKSSKFKTKLRAKLVDRIGEETRPAVAERDEDDEARPKKRKKTEPADEVDDENPNPEPEKAARDDDDDDDSGDDKRAKEVAARDADDDEEIESRIERRMAPRHTANRLAARIDAGMSFGNRSLVFTNRADCTQCPKPFRSSPVPGARFEVEMFPLAFLDPNSFIAGLGFAAEYDKTLSMKLETSAEPGREVKVNQSAWSVGGRFRIAFGKKPTSPTVTAGFDYGRRRFTSDRSVLEDQTSLNGLGSLDLPDTHYAYMAPGLGFRIPIGGMLAFTSSGRALFVSKAGPIQKANMYGKAKIFGFNADAGIDLVIANRFAFRALFEITQFGYTFVGDGGELANSRDGDPMSRDMGGAQDRSLGGVATFAVLY